MMGLIQKQIGLPQCSGKQLMQNTELKGDRDGLES